VPSNLEKYYKKNKDKLNLLFNKPTKKDDLYKSTKIIDFRDTKF